MLASFPVKAEKVVQTLEAAGLRSELDSRTESLNKKVREAQLSYIPLILTIGNKEKESGAFSVRTLDGSVKYGISRETFLNKVFEHIRERRQDLDIFKGAD